MYDVIIIGGGPAGLMASIAAAEAGAKTLLLEKMDKPARKLRITGKGRCNITNVKDVEEFMQHIFPDAMFFKEAFSRFSNRDLIDFINLIGIETVVERGDRVFPSSRSAPVLVDALISYAISKKVHLSSRSEVTRLIRREDRIVEVEYRWGERLCRNFAKTFIVATGGLSYPATGCTGDGYAFARSVQISVIPQRPSLTPLFISDAGQPRSLSIRNASLRLKADNRKVQEEFGEMEFCGRYVSGPCVLRLSRKAGELLLQKSKVTLSIDFKPALSAHKLRLRIERELAEAPSNVGLGYLLGKLMPRDLSFAFATRFQLDQGKNIHDADKSDIEKIVFGLKEYSLHIVGIGSFDDAIVTAGGVSLFGIHSDSMRAKKVDNLYFAGEVLDLDADTGGYNLQIAFSTGYLAGISAALSLGKSRDK
ncbi:MAG: aminoacetone oxidase family FAD-binding enzyme [Prevotellaceae bacterium]|jgi:predicted Rossmann fold flavoprotein|nr:aminoacetone oxidase family FAD-binding enzyme [Prevotellaceae bacterium]